MQNQHLEELYRVQGDTEECHPLIHREVTMLITAIEQLVSESQQFTGNKARDFFQENFQTINRVRGHCDALILASGLAEELDQNTLDVSLALRISATSYTFLHDLIEEIQNRS